MGFSEESPKVFHGGGWGAAARPCESFEPAPPAAFGRHESAFLCAASDEERAHGSAAGERRRVRACEAAPATVTWGADAAYLTSACSSSTASAAAALPSFVVPNAAAADEASNDPWIIPTHDGVYDSEMASSTTGEFVVFSYANPFLDPMEASPGGEGLVPDRSAVPAPQMQTHYRGSESRLDIDFSGSGVSPYGYASQIASRSLSPIDRLLALQVSPDVGVVPGDNSGAEFSYSLSNGSGDLNPSGEGPAVQLSGAEREAKVLRYREKRKSRRFEKTIRYASRKAYAEARPRVRGRFVKRAEDEEGDAADCFYISAAASAPSPPAEFDFAEFRYGVVPSR